jgi:hypothetical protein
VESINVKKIKIIKAKQVMITIVVGDLNSFINLEVIPSKQHIRGTRKSPNLNLFAKVIPTGSVSLLSGQAV